MSNNDDSKDDSKDPYQQTFNSRNSIVIGTIHVRRTIANRMLILGRIGILFRFSVFGMKHRNALRTHTTSFLLDQLPGWCELAHAKVEN